jgi:hypothetical protein
MTIASVSGTLRLNLWSSGRSKAISDICVSIKTGSAERRSTAVVRRAVIRRFYTELSMAPSYNRCSYYKEKGA